MSGYRRPAATVQLPKSPSCTARLLSFAARTALLLAVSSAFAQATKAADPPAPPKPEDTELVTTDGVRLVTTFYAGTKGKETVPVVLLHGRNGSRKDFGRLATYLQSLGHAVLVPDLRGHGDSTERKNSEIRITADRMSSRDFALMVTMDMEKIKAFLIGQNNAGNLNLEKLCLVGADMGASVAICWTWLDWVRKPVGHKKQGQDVKAVVAISPEWNTPGLPLRSAMTSQPPSIVVYDPQLQKAFKESEAMNFRLPVALDFRREVSMLIVVGKNSSSELRDAKGINKMLQPFHPEPPDEERLEKQDLFYGEFETKLQGTQMFSANLGLERFIANFIQLRLVKKSFPWAERKDPYSE